MDYGTSSNIEKGQYQKPGQLMVLLPCLPLDQTEYTKMKTGVQNSSMDTPPSLENYGHITKILECTHVPHYYPACKCTQAACHAIACNLPCKSSCALYKSVKGMNEKWLSRLTKDYLNPVMFFGMCYSPATFQSIMNKIFVMMIEEKLVIIYMDNISIFAKTKGELQ